jgi:hypothetical protein
MSKHIELVQSAARGADARGTERNSLERGSSQSPSRSVLS